MADLRITELSQLPGASLAPADVLPITDVSASQTKKITAKDLVQYGVALIDANSIPSDKFNYTIPDGSVTEAQLADGSVTALKLADNSSGLVSAGVPASGDRIGQLAVDTLTNKLYVWSGSQWLLVQAAGSVNTVNGDTTGLVVVAVNQVGDTVAVDAELADTAAPRQFLAGPTAGGGQVSQRQIVGLDLPPATSNDLGGISAGSGLTVDAAGNLSIDNVVAPQAVRSLSTWNENGLVTGGSPIEGADLPVATENSPGAVYPGGSLVVDNTGQIYLPSNTTPGVYTKVTVNAEGLVTLGSQLQASDIPDISADQITTGTFDDYLIADRSIEEIKLADYSTCYVQEGNPGGGSKLGQFWFTPSTSQLRVYGRGSGEDLWLSVGFGALQAQNLRWAGTIDADTSTIVSLTAIGVSEGLSAGSPIPSPSDALSGVYFITQVAGSNINHPNVGSETFTEGDWLLCIDQAQGYTHIDSVAGGGGGGGGAQFLDDLLDVEIGGLRTLFGAPRISLTDGQLLMYDSISGMWVNSSTIDGGSY